MFRFSPSAVWRAYKNYVESVIQLPLDYQDQDIVYWQKKVFATAVLYALPLSFFSLIPFAYIKLKTLSASVLAFETFAAATFGIIALSPKLPIDLRKLLVVAFVAIIAITLTILLGEFSMLCIYLLSLSVFVALTYSSRFVYVMVGFNILVLISFALAIRFQLLGMHLVMDTDFDSWIIYSLHFVLLNLTIVTLTRQFFNGLVSTMRKETEDYKTLFFHSPSPKLIYDIDTLQFLKVNLAAINVYGYTEEEFLNMSLTDIYPQEGEEIMAYQSACDDIVSPPRPIRTEHLGKDARHIHSEVRLSDITFKGRRARMMVATDITKCVQFTDDIQHKNQTLKEIAFIESHVLRLPVARIMSISELISSEYSGKVDQELLTYLNASTEELDAAIRVVVDKCTKASPGHSDSRTAGNSC